MPKTPELLDMIQAGMHFGHRSTRWHPKIKPYLFGERQGIHVINLEVTQQKLTEALDFVKQLAAQNKTMRNLGVMASLPQWPLCGWPFTLALSRLPKPACSGNGSHWPGVSS